MNKTKPGLQMIFTAAVFTLVFSAVAAAQNTVSAIVSEDARIQKIDRLLSEREKDGLHGVILIRSRDRVLLRKAYGFADRKKNKRMRISDGFDIGSIVKPMTAVAVLKLEQQGKLSTEDTLGRFFPDAPEDKKSITIRQLLTHTAGMPDIFGDDYEVVSRQWFLDKALNAKLIAPPGEKRRYSNAGYSLLAVIIENTSGQNYEKFVREEVLKPAGVRNIGYVLAGWKNEDLAVGYRTDDRWGSPLDHKWAADGPGWNLRGNGGMLASTEELSRWFEALLDGKVLGPQALEKYLKTFSAESKTFGSRVLGPVGGNGIFNALQVSIINADLHMTFFTSNAKYEAEKVFREFRDEIIALAAPPGAAR